MKPVEPPAKVIPPDTPGVLKLKEQMAQYDAK